MGRCCEEGRCWRRNWVGSDRVLSLVGWCLGFGGVVIGFFSLEMFFRFEDCSVGFCLLIRMLFGE